MQTVRWIVLGVAAVLVLAAVPGVAQAGPESKYDEHLAARLARDPLAPVGVIVMTDGEPDAAARAARELGAQVRWTYDIIHGFAATLPAPLVERLAERPDVVGVYLDRPVTTVMDVSHRAVEADKAWAAGYDGAGITVAVIDTGIDSLHPFFSGAIAACVSTIGGLISPECTDSDGHGTHVAGSVASRDTKHPGIARGAKIAAVRVLHVAGAGTSSDIIAGMDWVRANKDKVSPPIRVATMSIGFVDPGCGDGTGPEAEAANNLVSSGVPFTVAAGNSGHKSCTIDGASAAAKVTTIAAVDDKGTISQGDDVIASFSSGGSSKNNKPDLALPGVDITSAYLGGLTATLDGTSMATPHAAGIYALLLHKEPTLTWDAAKKRLTDTAVKTSNTGSSFNYVYGHGLGNACRALQLSDCGTVAPPPDAKKVHVGSITMSFKHGSKTTVHDVTTVVKIVDGSNAAVSGATVSLTLTSPEGNSYSLSGTTGSDGTVSLTKRQNSGGHGTWQSCVTSVSGTGLSYDSAANAETCDTLAVS